MQIKAVIDIGATAVRLLVAEIDTSEENWRVIDRCERSCELGRDVFETGDVRPETIKHLRSIISGFIEHLKSWKIKPQEVETIATSALREAGNREMITDRIKLNFGIDVQIIEGAQANYYTYLVLRAALKDSTFIKSRNALVIEVSGGATEVILLRRGKIAGAHSLNVGQVRLIHQLAKTGMSREQLRELVQQSVHNASAIYKTEIPLKQIYAFLALGSEIRFVANRIGQPAGEHYRLIKRKVFEKFLTHIENCSVAALSNELGIPAPDAEGLYPALQVYASFIEKTGAKEIIVPDVSIREGLLLHSEKIYKNRVLLRQIRASALSLCNKYLADGRHARNTEEASLKIFKSLSKHFALDSRHKLYLQLAAILHDIGKFISHRAHHKHSSYLVRNSEIFALSAKDLNLIATIVRYHRKSFPSTNHPEFRLLSADERIMVIKLSAILRLADDLDRPYEKKCNLQKVELDLDEGSLKLFMNPTSTAESLNSGINSNSMFPKGQFFSEVFDLRLKYFEMTEK